MPASQSSTTAPSGAQGNSPPLTFRQALTLVRQTATHGLVLSSGHGQLANTFPAPQLANLPFFGQPATIFPYPLLPRVHHAHINTLAAQQLVPHPAMAQPSAVRLAYTPQLIRKQVPAPAIVQHTLTSVAAVQAYRANRAIPWHPLQNDETIPRNEAECLLYVDTMLTSLTDVRECKDSERTPFPKRWTIPATQGRFYYKEDDMANAAWDILDIMMALHLFGPSALKTCRPEDIKEISKDQRMSFEERARKICNVLRLSKHRCAMVIAGDSAEAFVALVSKKERELDSNSANNGRRSSNLSSLKARVQAAETALANPNASSANSASTVTAAPVNVTASFSTSGGAQSGSNRRKGAKTVENPQSSDNSGHLATEIKSHGANIDVTLDQDFNTEFAAWSTRQAELQSPAEDYIPAHTFNSSIELKTTGDELAVSSEDDDFAYLDAFNAAYPLPGDVNIQGAALQNDALLYDGDIGACSQVALSDHHDITISSQKYPGTGNDLEFGADLSLGAGVSSYAHYLQSLDDQTEFSEYLQDPSKNRTASPSAAGKRVSEMTFDDGQDQYGVAAPSKRMRRDGSSSEEPTNISVNSLLHGKTARRTYNPRNNRRC